MQKLDFLVRLRSISTELRTNAVLPLLDADLNDIRSGPSQAWARGQHLLPLLLDAKSSYDRLKETPETLDVLRSFGADNIFETVGFARMLGSFSAGQPLIGVYQSVPMLQLLVCYRVLQGLIDVSSKLLISEPALLSLNSEEAGILVFQITGRADNDEINNYVKIFQALEGFFDKLSQTLESGQTAHAGQLGMRHRVMLLDSGSATNVAIQTTVAAAKLAFEVFKEVWDYLVNRRHYQNKIENASLIANLKSLAAIKEAGKNGLLDPEKCDQYSALLIRKTDELIRLNVLPKKIAVEVRFEQNTALLNWLNPPKQIELSLKPPSSDDGTTKLC